ncbi:retrovirus-related pol polyprotein from transposon TNT 1-94 [Tanacetum coccineum]
MAAEVPQTLEYKGIQLNAAPMLEVENFTNWKKRSMCHIIGIEPHFKIILLNGPYVPMIAGQRKPENQWTADERKDANLDQRLKSLILFVLLDDQMYSVINYSPDDEENKRNSQEYMNDLDEEYQTRALLAKSERFFKKGTQRFSTAKATDQTECHKCGRLGHFTRDYYSKTSVPSYQSPFQPKLLNSPHHKPEIRPTNDFEAKYNKIKAKPSLLRSNASASKSSMVKNKVIMALADDENATVGKENSINGEWVKIAITEDTNVLIPGVEQPWLSEAEGSILPNHDTERILIAETQTNTTESLVVDIHSSATDESSVCSNSLSLLEKLGRGKPVSGPKIVKSILKSNSTSKNEVLKGVTLKEPHSAPTKNKGSASKTNSNPAGKFKGIKTKDDPPLAVNDIRKPIWYMDSGCSRHMTGVKSYLYKYVEQLGPKVVFRDDSTCTTEGYGSIKCNGIVFTRVAIVNGLKYNLFSISQLCDAKYIVQFDEKKASENLNLLWHKRLSYLNFKTINQLAKQNLVIGLPSLVYSKDKPCPSCEKGKHHRAIFKPKQTFSMKSYLHLLYMDLFGPIIPRFINHEKYTLVIIEECLRRIPNIDFLHVFGCPVYINNHKDYLGKFDEKADDGYFLGYSLISKAFMVFNTRRQQTEETYHITFDESIDAIKFTKSIANHLIFPNSERYLPYEYSHPYEPSQQYQVPSNTAPFIDPYENPEHDTNQTSNQNLVHNDEILNDDQIEHSTQDHDNIIENISTNEFGQTSEPSPKTKDALGINTGPYQVNPSVSITDTTSPAPQDKWTQNKHIELVNIIGNPGSGMLIRDMAKELGVASAHECLFVNFLLDNEPKKVFEALQHLGWVDAMQEELNQFSRNKFWTLVPASYGKTIIGTKWPSGFESSKFPKHVCKLDKALYRLKQAPRACMMGVLTYFLGFQIKQSDKGILSNQANYVKDLLRKYDINGASVRTPMVPPNNLGPNLIGKSINKTQYRGMIGLLLYLTASRPDIQFSTCLCAIYQANPKESHLIAVKRIFRYLKGTPNLGLCIQNAQGLTSRDTQTLTMLDVTWTGKSLPMLVSY